MREVYKAFSCYADYCTCLWWAWNFTRHIAEHLTDLLNSIDNRGIIVYAIRLRCLHMPTIHQHRYSPSHILSPSAFFLNVRLFIHFKLLAGRTPFVLQKNIASIISLYYRGARAPCECYVTLSPIFEVIHAKAWPQKESGSLGLDRWPVRIWRRDLWDVWRYTDR